MHADSDFVNDSMKCCKAFSDITGFSLLSSMVHELCSLVEQVEVRIQTILSINSCTLCPFDTRCSFLPGFIAAELTVHVFSHSQIFSQNASELLWGSRVARLHFVLKGGDLAIDFLRAASTSTTGFALNSWCAMCK